MNSVYVVILGNYALSRNMYAFSSKELAEGFKEHIRKEGGHDIPLNIFQLKVDEAVLKEEDM